MSRTTKPLTLTSNQRAHLQGLLWRATLQHRVARRCRTLLLVAEGLSNGEIAAKMGLHRNAVARIRSRFAVHGLASLEDAKRSGKPSRHLPATKQKIVTTVCGKPPKGLSRWNVRTLAAKLKLSKSFVHSVLVEHDLHPPSAANIQLQSRSVF